MTLPEHLESDHAWRDIRAALRRAVGDSRFDSWLARLDFESLHGSVLLLTAPAATRGWVAKRYGRVVESCARTVLGDDVRVVFADDTDAGNGSAGKRPQLEAAVSVDALNPRYSFDQFIIGDGNRLAHAAALTVAELPGAAYNPLFLHAPPGLGKTHLLHAIGNYLLAFGGGITVRYATAETFTNDFITALNSKSVERFKHSYRDTDVLLIDDVQFLASKAKTEEEFFHTFNAVYSTGRQLVLTCDRLPRQLVALEDRLRERFEAGLVAHLEPPDFATRVAILRKRAVIDSVPVSDPEVLEAIAERVSDNVRLLEGALIRVVAYHSLTDHPVDLELTKTVLDAICPAPRSKTPTIESIQQAVTSFYDLAPQDLVSSSRAARIVWPRQLAIHLAREHTHASLPAIGKAFGGRNHATVLHACKRVSDRLTTDQQARADLDKLAAAIRASEADRAC